MQPESGSSHRRLAGACVLLLIAAGLFWWLSREEGVPADVPTTPSAGGEENDPGLEAKGTSPTPQNVPKTSPPTRVAGDVLLVGQVVGADYRPRGGVTVHVRSSDRAEQSVQTTDDGRFELPFGARPAAQVHLTAFARASDGTVGALATRLNPTGRAHHELGTITLGSGVDVTVRVQHEKKPIVGARVFAASVPVAVAYRTQVWQGAPWDGWSHATTSNADGIAVLRDVPAGAVRLLAVADGPLRGEVNVRTDELATPVVLDLGRARNLRIEVVRASDGMPIPGCYVGAVGARRLLEEPWSRPVTDEHGAALMPHAPNTRIELLIAGPDWASAYLKMPRHVPPDVTTFRTEVPEPDRLLVPIEVADGEMPADGTRVALENDSWAWWPGGRTWLPREGVVRGEALEVGTYSSFGYIRANARLPDGRVGVLSVRRGPKAPPIPPVVFHAGRSVDVRITERGTGAPAAGVAVTLSVPQRLSVRVGPVRTDAQGLARIEGAPAAKGWIQLCSNPEWVGPARQSVFAPQVGVDLSRGDAKLDLQVEPIVDAVLQVRTDGRPGFPAGMELMLFYWPQGVGGVRPGGLRLDPERGELRFRARRPIENAQSPLALSHRNQVLHLRISSTTHATETVKLTYDAARDRLAGKLDLVRAGSLITRVSMPKDERVRFQLERSERSLGWTPVKLRPVLAFAGDPEQERYEGLPVGRYRLTELVSKESSPEVQVLAGSTPTVLAWNLGPLEYAEGTVVLPPGVEPKGLLVMAWAEAEPRTPPTRGIVNGTSFKIRVPGDRPVKLYASHPKCKQPEGAQPVVVTGPEKGLELRLELR